MFALRIQWDGKPVSPQKNPVKPVGDENARFYVNDTIRNPIFVETESVGGTIPILLPPQNGSVLGLIWEGSLHNGTDLAKRLALSQTASVEDIVLCAYRRWAEACLPMLLGDFAFVIWNELDGSVFAARDAMGSLPLYYFHSSKKMVFCTRARHLARSLEPLPKLSREGLALWVLNAYCEPVPLFEGIVGLGHGHGVVANSKSHHVWRFWDPWHVNDLRYQDPVEYSQHLDQLLETCVADRCESQTLGCMLSGGLDSATVAAYAKKHDPATLALTYQFHELRACDEWDQAALIVDQLGIAHQPLDAEAHWLLKDDAQGGWREDPFISWDQLTEVAMSQMVAAGKKVLLTGHGGDNMFTGISPLRLLGMALPSLTPSKWRRWYQVARRRGVSMPRGLFRYVLRPKIHAAQQRFDRWPNRFPWVSKKVCRQLFPNGFPWAPRQRPGGDFQRQMMVWMADDFSMGIRRAMHWYQRQGDAFGIAVRHPLFDRRIAEFMVAIPPEMVQMGEQSKGLLRQTVAKRLPSKVVTQTNKPTLAAYYYQGIAKEQKTLFGMMQDSFLVRWGLLDSEPLMKAFHHYLAADPNRALAWFLPALVAENWVRASIGEGFSI